MKKLSRGYSGFNVPLGGNFRTAAQAAQRPSGKGSKKEIERCKCRLCIVVARRSRRSPARMVSNTANEIIAQYMGKLKLTEMLVETEQLKVTELDKENKALKKELRAATEQLRDEKTTVGELKKDLKKTSKDLKLERQRGVGRTAIARISDTALTFVSAELLEAKAKALKMTNSTKAEEV